MDEDMVHRVMPDKITDLLPNEEEERLFDGEGIEYFVMESVSARRRSPGNRAMEYLDEKLHDTWITKKGALTAGALKLLTDFDRTMSSGLNVPDDN